MTVLVSRPIFQLLHDLHDCDNNEHCIGESAMYFSEKPNSGYDMNRYLKEYHTSVEEWEIL